MKLTRHAVQRFSERIETLPDDPIRAELVVIAELFSARERHWTSAKLKKKRTYIIPTPRCLFICERGEAIVTVLKRPEATA